MKDHGRIWKRFKKFWLNYSIASAVNEKEENVKVATFLHVAGEKSMEKYEGFLWENEDDKNNLNKIIEKFDEDFNERSNIIAEWYNFLSRKQRQDGTCDEFATAPSLYLQHHAII